MAANKIQVGYIEPQDGAQFKVDEGTAAAPGICFVDSAATGLYSPGTGQLAFSTSSKQTALRILADGKVGIDCSPTVALEVNGTIKATAIDAPIEGTLDDWIVHAGDTNTKIGFPGNDQFEIHAGGGPKVHVNSSGYVGINTSTMSNAERLAVQLGNDEMFELRSAAQELFQVWKEGSTEECRLNVKHGGATKIHIRGNGASYFNGGNLGINNTSPNARLEITDTSTAQIRLGYNATKYARIGRASSGNYEFFSQENGSPLIFGTAESSDGGGAEKMRIDRYGKVGIGTLAPADDRLTLYDSDNNVGMYFQCPQTGNANNNGLRIGRNPTHAFIWNYYDNPVAIAVNASQRLEVNSSGISVTGEVAASLDYPDIRPTLSLNFATDKKLDSRIRYQRPGSASYIDAKGFVRLVGDNVPRFDHDKDTGECKGLLIEETRTNINQSSTLQWVMTGWNQSRHGYEQYESETAPDGSTNAMLSYPNTGDNGSHYTYISSAGASLTGKRTISAWFKNLGTTTYYPQLRTFGRGNGVAHATFVLTGDGTVSSAGSAKTGATITKYPNGWYRCTLSWNDGTGHYGGGWVIGNHTSNELPSYVADTNKLKGFLVWGFQSEAGPRVTSLIPTSGIHKARGWEVPTITGTDLTDAFNPTEGTMFYEASVTDLTNDNQPIVAFRDVSSTTASYHAMGHAIGGSVGHVRVWARDASSNNIHLTSHSGLVAGNFYRHMYGYAYNNYSDAFVQGATTSTTDTTSGNHAMIGAGVIDELRFGGYYSGPETATYSLEGGHIKRFSYWKTKLTNTQIRTYVS